MYLTEDRTDIDQEKMARTQEAVAEALAITARQIRALQLGNWRTAPANGSKDHLDAMNMPLLAATEWYEQDGVRKSYVATVFLGFLRSENHANHTAQCVSQNS